MKKLLLIALFAAVPAWAQDKPAAPAASAPAAAAPAAAPAPEKAQHAKTTARKANPKRSEDARHCLDKESNTEIIKCAEAYL